MKRLFIVGFIAVTAFAACENNSSSTVGTYEYDDDSATIHSTAPEHSDDVIMPDTTAAHTDTLHPM